MININEYLLGKNKEKKFNGKNPIEKPKFPCDPEDVTKWIEGFGIDNWDEDHKWPDQMEIGEIGWHVETSRWGKISIWFNNKYGEIAERYVRICPKTQESVLSHGYMSKDIHLSFDEALDFVEAIINNPKEYIDPKTVIKN